MPTPKCKKSKSKKNMRRAHHALSRPAFNACPECGEPRRPHHACPSCGLYKGREVISVGEEAEA